MLRLCGESILKALERIFRSLLRVEIFLVAGKKANVVPIHKKVTSRF